MADLPKDNPKRAYKAAEVCELAHIQPYVLRSWESEFPKLGVLRSGTRIYRAADLEQVLRIKQLVFEEGLTLSGARRRIEEESGPVAELPVEEFVTPEMRQRIGHVKEALVALLALLGPGEKPTAVSAVADGRAQPAMRLHGAGDGNGQEPAGNGRAKRLKKKAASAQRTKVRETRTGQRARRRP